MDAIHVQVIGMAVAPGMGGVCGVGFQLAPFRVAQAMAALLGIIAESVVMMQRIHMMQDGLIIVTKSRWHRYFPFYSCRRGIPRSSYIGYSQPPNSWYIAGYPGSGDSGVSYRAWAAYA